MTKDKKPFDIIAFDADDTLWHNESLYIQAREDLIRLLEPYCNAEQVEQGLVHTEIKNVPYFGYGIKSYTLSMIETAIELSGGRMPAFEIGKIVNFARVMLQSPVLLFDGVQETISALARSYPLMLITKGDLLDQQAKVNRSGLAQYFTAVEIVSEKTVESYSRLLKVHNLSPERFMMVGNSLKSDVLPVVELGGCGVYIPFANTWVLEHAEPQEAHRQGCYYELEHMGLLGELVEQIENG